MDFNALRRFGFFELGAMGRMALKLPVAGER